MVKTDIIITNIGKASDSSSS